MSEGSARSMEEEKEYHRRYLIAISNPVRREILTVLKDGVSTTLVLKSKTGLDEKNLKWHLDMLERGSCVEKEIRDDRIFYRLTREGMVVNHLEG